MMETLSNIAQLLGGIVLLSANYPQIKKIVRTKSVQDFHPFYLWLVAIGISLMEFNAIYLFSKGQAITFFITNTGSLLAAIIMLIIYYYYSNRIEV